MGSVYSCAAGGAVLRIIREERLQENARAVGAALLDVLQGLHQKYEIIGDVCGRGLMLAVELVRDRATKESATEETADIFERTREMGLMLSKSGTYRNVLRIVPPLCITMDEVGFVTDAMEKAFSESWLWSLDKLSSVRPSRLIGGFAFKLPCGLC